MDAPAPGPPAANAASVGSCPAGSPRCERLAIGPPDASPGGGISRRAVVSAGLALELLCCLPGALGRTLAVSREREAASPCRNCPRRLAPR